MQNVHFSPPQLAAYLGVNTSTVKRWVDKGFLRAEVTPGGHRRVHKDEVARFLKNHRQYSSRSYIAKHLAASIRPVDAERYYQSLYTKDYVRARNDLTRLVLSGVPVHDVIEHIVRPTLVRVGQYWLDQAIDIADEHRMSFMVRSHLTYIDTLLEEPADTAPLALLACPRGERHEIPLIMTALILKQLGFRSEILGINVPVEDMVSEIRKIKPNLVGMSKLYSDNILERTFNTLVGKAVSAAKSVLLLGGNGWSQDDVSQLKKHAKAVHHILDSGSLVRCVVAARDTVVSR